MSTKPVSTTSTASRAVADRITRVLGLLRSNARYLLIAAAAAAALLAILLFSSFTATMPGTIS